MSSDQAHLRSVLAAVRGRIDSDADAGVLLVASAGEPAPADIRVPRAVSGRGSLRVGVAAVVALAVVAGGLWGGTRLRPDTPAPGSIAVTADASTGAPAPPPDLPEDASIIAFAAGSQYRAAGVNVARGVQSVDVARGNDPGQVATVSMTRPPGPAATPAAGRDPVTLGNGVVARWIAPTAVAGGSGPPQPDLLFWDSAGYAFTVRAAFNHDADAVAVAGAVRVGPPTPVRVPVAVSSWPPGWQPVGLHTTNVGVDPADLPGRSVTVLLDADATSTPGTSAIADLTLDVRALGVKGDDETGTPTVIGGRQWHWNPNGTRLTWHGSDRIVSIGASENNGASAVTPAELTSFVTRLNFAASFQDTSTWFDASAAFPS